MQSNFRAHIWPKVLLLLLSAGCQDLDLPLANVCYNDDVRPLVARDCSACHENGEYGVRLRGAGSDWQEILRYVVPGESSKSPFLLFANGFNRHPIIWSENSREYRSFAAWIDEGANRECDRLVLPDITRPEDAAEIHDAVLDADLADGVSDTDALQIDVMDDVYDVSDVVDVVPDVVEIVPDISVEPDIPEIVEPPKLSFLNDISPMHKANCKSCHGGGGFGIKIVGSVDDYSRVMKYVNIGSPSSSTWLQWAAGTGVGKKHPVIWSTNSTKYNTFLKWVEEGALNN